MRFINPDGMGPGDPSGGWDHLLAQSHAQAGISPEKSSEILQKTGKAVLTLTKVVAIVATTIAQPEVGIPWAVSDITGAPAIPSPQAWASSLFSTAGALKGTETVDNTVEITVSRNKFPQAAQHIDDAAANGVSTTGTIDRAGASARRSAATRSTPTRLGMDRDEVPPAVINNGGNGSCVRHIDMKDNRGAGGSIGQ